jgi:hypothetical protein
MESVARRKRVAAVVFCTSTVMLGACGGRIDASSDPAAAAVPTPEPQKPAKARVPTPTPDPGEENPNPNVCPNPNLIITEDEMVTMVGSTFKGPPARASACSDNDIANLRVNVHDVNRTTVVELGDHLSEECKGCIFTHTSDPAWGAVVMPDVDTAGSGFINLGACPAAVTGNMACGSAIHYGDFCPLRACSDCLTYESLGACNSKVETTGCKPARDAINATCDSATIKQQCGDTIVEHVQYLCAMK